MGCMASKDSSLNTFEVWNLDESGNQINHGLMEITETEIVLHQRGKQAIRWPMRSVRRYGFDEHMVTFECGRRCPTGAGLYGFRCLRAEALFTLLQQYAHGAGAGSISSAGAGEENATGGAARQSHSNGNIAEFAMAPIPRSASLSLSRGDSSSRRVPCDLTLTSGGPLPAAPSVLSPTSRSPLYTNEVVWSPLSPPPLPPVPEKCADEVYSMLADSTSLANGGLNEVDNYARLDDLIKHEHNLYMNVTPEWNSRCYANVGPAPMGPSPELTPPPSAINRQMNYAVLDLERVEPVSPVSAVVPDSPRVLTHPAMVVVSTQQLGYATIDFDKTAALSNSTQVVDNSGVRKTRHSSTMSEVLIGSTRQMGAAAGDNGGT